MAKLFITLMLLIGMAAAESLPGEPTTNASDLQCKQFLALPDRERAALDYFDSSTILKDPVQIMNGAVCYYFVLGMMEETQSMVMTDRAITG